MRNFFLFLVLLFTPILYAQDIIFTKEGKRIEAKILEVSKAEIKYKAKSYLDGPTFTIPVEDLKSVVYGNGMETIYSGDEIVTKMPDEKVAEISNHSNQFIPQNGNINYGDTFDLGPTEIYFYDFNAPELTKKNPYNLKPIPDYIMTELCDELDGLPKRVVAIQGNYEMLYDKHSCVYIDYEVSRAIQVEYDHYETDFKIKGKFDQELLTVDKDVALKNACDAFNNKMIRKKCKMLPIYELKEVSNVDTMKTFIAKLYIEGIDVGNDMVSTLSINSSTSGGVLITGKLNIYDISGSLLCQLIVDRVKGFANPYFDVRFQNTMIELWGNRLFYIYDL